MTVPAPGVRARLLVWSPDALLLALQFFLSSQSKLPEIPLAGGLPGFDKVEHAFYSFLVGMFAVRATRFLERWPPRRTFWTLLLAATAWGLLDEFHQSFVPGRSVEAGDVVADVAGMLVALFAGERIWTLLGMDRVRR